MTVQLNSIAKKQKILLRLAKVIDISFYFCLALLFIIAIIPLGIYSFRVAECSFSPIYVNGCQTYLEEWLMNGVISLTRFALFMFVPFILKGIGEGLKIHASISFNCGAEYE